MLDPDAPAFEEEIEGEGAADEVTAEGRASDLERPNSGSAASGSTSKAAMQGIGSCCRAIAVASSSEEEEAFSLAFTGSGRPV